MRLSETGRQCCCRSWADALRKRRHGTRRLYRAIDRDGNLIDAMLGERRDMCGQSLLPLGPGDHGPSTEVGDRAPLHILRLVATSSSRSGLASERRIS
jgi:hypothetical protein